MPEGSPGLGSWGRCQIGQIPEHADTSQSPIRSNYSDPLAVHSGACRWNRLLPPKSKQHSKSAEDENPNPPIPLLKTENEPPPGRKKSHWSSVDPQPTDARLVVQGPAIRRHTQRNCGNRGLSGVSSAVQQPIASYDRP